MFRATMCPSSGDYVFMWHLVLVILCGWLVCRTECNCTLPPCIPDSRPHRITSAKCLINTVVSPDDGHIVARNMQRLINILRINCVPSWLYLQDYTGMQVNKTEIFNWINQPDASIPQIYCSSFKYSSTFFGHPLAHHQELQQLQ